MSILPNTVERCCAACFPQPVSRQDGRDARRLAYTVYYINCVLPTGPRLANIVYRNSAEERDITRHVFRFDLRDYTDIFQNGFRARPQEDTADDDYYNLLNHVNNAGAPLNPNVGTPRAFLSTTVSSSLATRFTNPIGTVVYRYEIYAPGGISVDQTLGEPYNFPGQEEITFVGGIAPQYIRAVQLFTITAYNVQGFARLERSNPVCPQIVLNHNFQLSSLPEEEIIIENPTYYFMNRDNQRQGLQIVIWPRHRVPRSISDDTHGDKWYTHDVFDHETYIDAAFRSSHTNEAYLFMKNEYVRINYNPGTKEDKILNGPELISDGDPSLANTVFGEQGIDCAFGSHKEYQAYIFSSNLCAVISYTPDKKDDKIEKGPMTIASMFPFFKNTVFEDGIDAAFEATYGFFNITHAAFLFKGDQYALIKFDDHSSASLTAIRSIACNFNGLTKSMFKDGIGAAFASHRDDEAYVFKEKYYALINFAPETNKDYIVGGQVKEILPNWPSLSKILPRKNRGLDAHAHE